MEELIQVVAILHPFFQGNNESYTLHGFMDDATGNIMGLYMQFVLQIFLYNFI